MLPRILKALTAGPLAWAGAWIYITANDGFGRGDLEAFALWCLVFALATAAVSVPAGSYVHQKPGVQRGVAGAVVGLGFGILFTYAMAFGLGGWILTFSFPTLWLLALAGALAFAWGWATDPAPIGPKRTVWLASALVGTVAIPAILPLAFMLGSAYVWNRGRHERFILPAGYQGPAYIIYNQPSAPPLPRVDGVHLVAFPSSGVVLTSSPVDEGWGQQEVVYRDSLGRETPVKTTWDASDTSGVRTFWLGTEYRSDSTGTSTTIPYSAFIIGRHNRDDMAYARARYVLDSLWPLVAR